MVCVGVRLNLVLVAGLYLCCLLFGVSAGLLVTAGFVVWIWVELHVVWFIICGWSFPLLICFVTCGCIVFGWFIGSGRVGVLLDVLYCLLGGLLI